MKSQEQVAAIIGSNIRYLRGRQRMTQIELVDKLAVKQISQRKLSAWEMGKALPTIGLLMRLMNIFKVDLERLLRGTGLLNADDSIDFDVNVAARRRSIVMYILKQVTKTNSYYQFHRTIEDGVELHWAEIAKAEHTIYWDVPDAFGLLPEQVVDTYKRLCTLSPTEQQLLQTKKLEGWRAGSTWVAVNARGQQILRETKQETVSDPRLLKIQHRVEAALRPASYTDHQHIIDRLLDDTL